jgi:hypothetical protein
MLKVLSEDLCRLLSSISLSSPRSGMYPEFETNTEIRNPHFWIFSDQEHIVSQLGYLTDIQSEQLSLFLDYFLNDRSQEFTEVADLLSRGFVSRKYLEHIFVSSYPNFIFSLFLFLITLFS